MRIEIYTPVFKNLTKNKADTTITRSFIRESVMIFHNLSIFIGLIDWHFAFLRKNFTYLKTSLALGEMPKHLDLYTLDDKALQQWGFFIVPKPVKTQ